MTDFRIGISGWRYTPWRSHFYPKGLTQNKELYFASRSVNSIEINGSFYSLQTPERYANWYADTPEDFVFSVKAPRYISHIKRLRDVEEPVSNFFASGVLELKEKLGPILWQFPPSFKFDEELFTNFVKLLPHSAEAAAECAREWHRDFSVPNDIDPKQRIRHAVEIRNVSFMVDEFFHLLKKNRIAFVVADTAGRWPYSDDITSDFVYMRLHGDQELYRSGYSDEALARWFNKIEHWSQGKQIQHAKLTAPDQQDSHKRRDVFCYFDNTDKLWAPFDARKILDKLGLLEKQEMEPGVLPDALKSKRKKAD